ncbi:hypothetical protein BHYA_0153g00110 [Botrytis hyacinthi]|uniref:DUF6546 domain-containing protein n=1 Tax=Botrytis hyacinthi TaxID=278943 RepID=A0A4Z1GPK7_9HELO|nr:hypothetical protein BHYA_0153g00110 [Botrytis hyacinthi]
MLGSPTEFNFAKNNSQENIASTVNQLSANGSATNRSLLATLAPPAMNTPAFTSPTRPALATPARSNLFGSSTVGPTFESFRSRAVSNALSTQEVQSSEPLFTNASHQSQSYTVNAPPQKRAKISQNIVAQLPADEFTNKLDLFRGPEVLVTAGIQLGVKRILDLFTTLSVWEPGSSLLLDISVHSPSDSEHWFKYLTFDLDVAFDMFDRNQHTKTSMPVRPTDHHHGWIAGSRNSIPSLVAVEKVFGEIFGESPFDRLEQEDQWWQRLPLVPVITDSRKFTMNLGGNELMIYRSGQIDKLIIFENFDQTYSAGYGDICAPMRIPSSSISRAIANASFTLEHLSISFMVEANHFFKARELSWKWPNLTWLALTSRLPIPQGLPAELDDVLQAAAAAAMNMPNLEIMEMWNGEKGLAMLFRYQRGKQGQPAVITWKGTWELNLRPLVIQAWESVSLKHCGEGVVVIKELLDISDDIKSHVMPYIIWNCQSLLFALSHYARFK